MTNVMIGDWKSCLVILFVKLKVISVLASQIVIFNSCPAVVKERNLAVGLGLCEFALKLGCLVQSKLT